MNAPRREPRMALVLGAVAALLAVIAPSCTRKWDQTIGSPSDCDACNGIYSGDPDGAGAGPPGVAVDRCVAFCALDGDRDCACSYRCVRDWGCGSDPTCSCLMPSYTDENFPDAVTCTGQAEAGIVVSANYCE